MKLGSGVCVFFFFLLFFEEWSSPWREAAEAVWPVGCPWCAELCLGTISSAMSQLVLVGELLSISDSPPWCCRGVWMGVRAVPGCPSVGVAKLSAISSSRKDRAELTLVSFAEFDLHQPC